MMDNEKKYNLAVYCVMDYVDGVQVYGERMVLEDGATEEIAIMSGNYWVKKFPDDIVMLVEVQ